MNDVGVGDKGLRTDLCPNAHTHQRCYMCNKLLMLFGAENSRVVVGGSVWCFDSVECLSAFATLKLAQKQQGDIPFSAR